MQLMVKGVSTALMRLGPLAAPELHSPHILLCPPAAPPILSAEDCFLEQSTENFHRRLTQHPPPSICSRESARRQAGFQEEPFTLKPDPLRVRLI